MSINSIASYGIRHTLLFLLMHTLLVLSTNAEDNSVTSYWEKNDTDDQTRVDHSQWQKFLDRYLHQTQDGRSLLAYKSVDTSGYVELEEYVQDLSRLDPRVFNRAEQMAFWINLYNALTVKVVLDNPDKSSITKMGQRLFSFGPWDEDVVSITSQSLSLNDIEHQILRPIWKDERVHYALNCASLGCPNLASTVFQSENMVEKLNKVRAEYLEHPRAIHFDARGDLHVSSLFQWYLGDFAKDESALLIYLASHRTELHERILGYTGKIRYEYDWDLNSLAGYNNK